MSRSDFNIVVGVNLNNAEKSIKEMIDNIGTSYPLQLKAVLSNKNELASEVKSILGLLNGKDDLKLNINDSGIKDTGKNIKQGISGAKKEVEQLSQSMQEAIKQYDLLKRTMKENKTTGSKTKTEVTGNDFGTKTYQIDDNNNKVVSETNVEDFKKLSKYIESASKELQNLKEKGNVSKAEIKELENELSKLGKFKSGSILSDDFNNQFSKVQSQLVSLSDKNKQIIKEKQAISLAEKESESWNKKLNSLTQKGYTHHKQVESLKGKIAKLTSGELKDLESVQKQLKLINDQYAKAEQYQQKTSFEAGAVRKANKQTGKASKLDGDVVGADNLQRLNDEISKIPMSANVQQLEQAMNRVSKTYDELIEKQKTINNLKRMEINYNEKLDDVNYNATKNEGTKLRDEQNILAVKEKIAEIERLIASYKNRGSNLNADEESQLRREFKELQRLTSARKQDESDQERIQRKIQQMAEKSESIFYRSARGLDRNVVQLREVQREIDAIRRHRDESLINLTGDRFDEEYRNLERRLTQLSQRSRELRDDARRQDSSFLGRFARAMSSVPVWISAMSVFYGAVAQVRQGFQSLVEIDSAMINLGKVTEATNEQMEEFKHHASDIGYNLGVTTAEVINATAEFQKLGYSIEQASALAKNSILYANVGDMDVDTATKNIVSAVKGFDIEVDPTGENILAMVDMFNEVSNNFAITSEGIGEALSRSSAVLTQAGNSIEQSIAIVTAANTTIQNPTKVGNALKTVSMRLRGMEEDGSSAVGLVSELDSAFQSLGKNMTIMKDANTFKSTYEIMDMLAKEWENLSDVQQAYMTELIGGKEQGAIVASMLQNWGDAVNSYETALNSAGSANREFQAYQEGFEYKINQLKVAVEEFWVALVNDDAIKNLIEDLTSLVQVMTNLVELFGSETLLANISALFLLLLTPLRGVAFDFSKQRTQLDNFKASVVGMTGSFAKFGQGLKGIAGIAGMFLKRLIPILGVVTLLTTATSAFLDWKNRESIARQENITRLEDEIQKYETLKGTMESANLDEYLALDSRKSSLNNEELQRHQELQEQIKEQMPELVSHYDEQGNAVFKTTEQIRKLIAEQEKLYAQNREELTNEKIAEADFSELQDGIDDINNQIKNSALSTKETEAYNFAKKWVEDNVEALESGKGDVNEKLGELFDAFSEKLGDNPNKSMIQDNFTNEVSLGLSQGDTSGVLKFLDKYSTDLNKRTMKLNDEIDTAQTNLTEKMADFNVLMQDQMNNYLFKNDIEQDSNEALFVGQIRDQLEKDITKLGEEDVKEVLENFPKYVSDAIKGLDKTNVNLDELMTFQEGDTKESINKMFDGLTGSIEGMNLENGEQLISILNRIEQTRVEDALARAEEGARSLNAELSDVSANLEEAQSDIAFINGKLEEYKEHNTLSASSIMEIVEQYPSLLGYMNNEAKLIDELKKLKEQDVDVARKALAKKLELNEQFYQQNLKALQSYVAQQFKFYKGELDGFKNLAQAKADIETQLINKLARSWGVYYDKVLDSFSIYASVSKWTQSTNSFGIDLGQAEKALGAQKELNSFRNKFDDFSLGRINIDVGSIGASMPKDTTSKKDKAKEQEKQMQDAYYVADKYQQTVDLLNEKIARQQALLERYPKYSKQYKDALNLEIGYTKQKKSAIDSEIVSLEKQIKARKIAQKGLISVNTGEDNRTARAKNAELQQQIDEATARLNGLRTESIQTQNEVIQLTYDMMEAQTEYYNINIEALEDEIALTEHKMGLYEEGSSSYKKFAQDQLKYLKEQRKYQQQELDYLLAKKKNSKDLTSSQINDLNALIREARVAVIGLDDTIYDLQTSLMTIEVNKLTENFEKEAEKSAKAIEALRDKIDYELEDEGDYAKNIDYLQDILSLSKGQVNTAKENIKQLEALKKQYYGNHEVVSQINDEIEGWQDTLLDAERGVKDLNKEIKTMYKDMADEFVDLYVEQLELMQKVEEERYDNTMKAEQEAHDARMEHLDDELEIIRKIYNDRMEMIDREESTRTFGNDMEELQKEAEELQKTINKLSLDDSFEASAKRSELNKQLADINKQIAERQHDREIELRKQNLEDDLEAQEEALESQKDKYQEDYDAFVKNEEKKKETRDKYWEQQLNDERKFAEIREQVMSGNFDNLEGMLRNWSYNISSEMGILGNVISDNFTSKIQEAIEQLILLKEFDLGSFDSTIGVGATKPENSSTLGNTERKKQLTSEDYKLLSGKFISSQLKKYATTDSQAEILQQRASSLTHEARKNGSQLDPNITESYDDLFKTLSEEEKILMAKYIRENTMQYIVSPHLREALVDLTDDIASDSRNYVDDVDLWSSESFLEALNKYVKGFSSGGYTGDSEGITKVHKSELILDKENTSTIKQFLGTDSIKDRLKEMFDTNRITQSIFNSLQTENVNPVSPVDNSTKNENESVVQNVNNYNLTLKVDKLTGTKKEATIVGEQILNGLKRTQGGNY